MSNITMTLSSDFGDSLDLTLNTVFGGISCTAGSVSPIVATVGLSVPGPQGLSAYQVWLAEGNTGEESDFIASLKGESGDDAHVSPLSLTLTVAGWTNNSQTVASTGVTSTNFIIVSPTPASQTHYVDCGVLCWSQSTDSLVFKCDATPTEELYVNVGVFS